MRANHDDPIGGHFGGTRTVQAIHWKYFWHGLRTDVNNNVQTCRQCQLDITPRHKPYGELEPLPPPREAFEVITMDSIMKLPPSERCGRIYDSILAVVCPLTKFYILPPYSEARSAENLAQYLIDRVFATYGIPKYIVSDRASVFATSKFWSTLCFYL